MSPAEAATLAFFKGVTQAATIEELADGFGACVAAHGFQRAVCFRIATPGQPVHPQLLFGWRATEMSARYVAERHYRVDPTIPALFGAVVPFSWDELEPPSNADTADFYHALLESGVRNGLVVPLHGPRGEVLCVVLISEDEEDFPDDLRRRMHVAATLFAALGLTLVEREAEPPSPDFTRREIQCVYWIAQGKSDWEIAEILGISEDTVAWHVQNAKAKLGVTRRAQLPSAAWRLGLLLDESTD